MSLTHGYGKMRGFSRSGAPDTAAAGHTILSLLLDGRLPYAVPPPVGEPVCGVHIGIGGGDSRLRHVTSLIVRGVCVCMSPSFYTRREDFVHQTCCRCAAERRTTLRNLD
jgi:hypothetical protein